MKKLFGVERTLSRRRKLFRVNWTFLSVLWHLSQHVSGIVESLEFFNLKVIINLGDSNTKYFNYFIGGMSFELGTITSLDGQITIVQTPMSMNAEFSDKDL